MATYELTVNSRKQAVTADPGTPLLWVLRDDLKMTGTKYGCGIAACGACTVHVGGVATRSCQVKASEAQGAKITTIEGLSPNGTHAVQRAWEELDVPQCGYCQAGQIMSAVSLLAKNPKPTDADIDAAMDRNLCRCATYLRIRQAIHRAAELTAADGSPPGRSGSPAALR
jgi:isoquinoline 1-oxidoreductase alpha subunit